jgi:hypothetical protein
MATATTAALDRQPPRLVYSEILSFAYETFCSNKVRFALTALGMVIGTASLILVVTIGMTGKQYVLSQIQSIGTNQIEAEYQSGGQRIANVTPDPLTIDDMNAAMEEVPGIVAASPVVPLGERIPVGGGKERDISVRHVHLDPVDNDVGRHAAENAQFAAAERNRCRGGDIASRGDVEVRCCRRYHSIRTWPGEHTDESAARRIGRSHVDGCSRGGRIDTGERSDTNGQQLAGAETLLN